MAKKKQPAQKKVTTKGAGARREIDRIDRELLALLSERAVALHQAGEQGKESETVDKVVAQNQGPLTDRVVGQIFREIVAGCRVLAQPTRVAYLGPEHTFSHMAAIEHFGSAGELAPVASIRAVFEEVEQGLAPYGIVPLENSTDGRVTDTLGCFAQSQVQICGELPLRIHQCLVGLGPRSGIQRVESKPQALSQCRQWLATHLSHAESVAVASTADAAKRAAGDPSVAAIASGRAAAEYGLDVLAANIEDNPDNITRFAVISQQTASKTGRDKTALMLEIVHEPGALADAMAIFKRQKLNMTWIESFPIVGSRGRYLFFIEFLGHATELRARRAIASLEKKATQLRVLGSYAQAEPIG